MPVRIRDAPRSLDEIRGTPQPGVFSQAATLGKRAVRYGYDLITDPLKAAARGLAYVPEPIRKYQDTIDAPTLDADEPDDSFLTAPARAFGYKPTKGETRGFKAGMLDNANLGTIAEVGAMAASGGTSGLASLATRAGLKVPGLIRGANTAARVSGQVSRAADYSGIVGGGLETVEGLREGDIGRAAVGAGMAGLGGVSRYTSQPRADAPRANDFWTEFAQEAPERPAQTPLERVRKDQFDTLFADETPIGSAAQAVRTAAEPPPTFSPAKPRAGQSTLQPVSDLPVSGAPAGPVASRAARARALNPRKQDPGVLPQARPRSAVELEADAMFPDEAPDVLPSPAQASDDALRAMFESETPAPREDRYDLGELQPPREALTDDIDELAGLFADEVPVAPSTRPPRPEPTPAELERSFLEDIEQDARMQGADTESELQTLIDRIAKGGGIGSMDDATLTPTRKSFRQQKRAGGELARAKKEGGGFGRWGKTRGMFTPGGQHQDVWATDLIRRHPEYAGKFETGDELLQYIDDLQKQSTYRDAPAPLRSGKLPAEAGYRSTPETRANRKGSDRAIDLKERRAIQDDGTGTIRGSKEFDPVELETGVAAEVPVVPARPLAPELKAMIEREVNARPANDVNEFGPPPPVVDTLPTGEAQPRLPGDTGAVRDANVPTPRVAEAPEQSFNLAAPPVKPPAQPDLPQGLPEGTPQMRREGPSAGPLPLRGNEVSFARAQLKLTPEQIAEMGPEKVRALGEQARQKAQAAKAAPVAPAVASVATVAPDAPQTAPPAAQRARPASRADELKALEKKIDSEGGDPGDTDRLGELLAEQFRAETAPLQSRRGVKGDEGGTKLHANPLADTELWKKSARVLLKTPAGRFYLGAVGGALVGNDQDDPWSETAKNAVLGGLAASLANRKTAKEVMAALERRRLGTGLYGERGVRPVLPDAGEKWSAWDKVRSPQRSIPDVMRKVQPKFEVAEQAIRGFDAEGKPIKGFKSNLTPEEQKLAVKESLKDVRATLRSEGKRLWEGGEKQKARLVRELLSRVENRPTLVAELFGGGTGARRLDSFLAKAQYFQSLAWNMGLGRILNPTQKYFALNYVPMGSISKAKKLAKSPEGQARTDFLHVERASDDPDMLDLTFMESLAGDRAKQAQTLWERFMEKTGGNALRASDEMNRRVTYLAAADYAKEKGGVQSARGFDKSPEAIHRWAMDVVNQTQSVVGPMGQSPYVSRIGKSVTTFTKFSTLAMELAVDAVQNPRPETLGLIAVAASMAMANKALPDEYELDLVKMFAPRAMVSLPAYGQAKNAISQATNTNQPAAERAVRTLAPDSPERYYDELFGEGGFFRGGGMGTHRHPNRYGSVDEHSGTDALARMFGVETASNSERIVASQRQRNFQKRTQAESAERNRPKNQAAKAVRTGKSKPGEASKDAIRRTVPVRDRAEYDKRFGTHP